MGAKLIFYQGPLKSGEIVNTFNFCPLMSHGCAGCFVPPVCKGEHDKFMAFNMRQIKGKFKITAIRSSRVK